MNIADLTVWWGEVEEARDLVVNHHYSRRWPANVQYVCTAHEPGGLFGTKGKAVGAIVWSIPPTRWRFPVLELIRMVRHPDAEFPLTWLISKCVSHIASTRSWPLLVSFADQTQGHEGVVYRAAGWNYNGKREPRMDGVVIDGEFYPGRTCNSLWGTQSPDRLREMFPRKTIEPNHDDGKHLYWKPTTGKGKYWAKEIGLVSARWVKRDEVRGAAE